MRYLRNMVFVFVLLMVSTSFVRAQQDDVGALKKQVAELQLKIADLEKRLSDERPSTGLVEDDPWDPFAEMRLMQRQIDALMGGGFGGYGPGYRGLVKGAPLQAAFSPDYDIKETDKTYILTFDMPGMDKARINVEVKQGALLISGERSSEDQKTAGDRFYRQERSFGYFSRVVPLPQNANADSVQAKYDNGVLKVTVDKKEQGRPKAEQKKKVQVK